MYLTESYMYVYTYISIYRTIRWLICKASRRYHSLYIAYVAIPRTRSYKLCASDSPANRIQFNGVPQRIYECQFNGIDSFWGSSRIDFCLTGMYAYIHRRNVQQQKFMFLNNGKCKKIIFQSHLRYLDRKIKKIIKKSDIFF